MPDANQTETAFHCTKHVERIEVVTLAAPSQYRSICGYDTRIRPFTSSFPGVDSLLIALVLRGELSGRWRIGETTADGTIRAGAFLIVAPGETIHADVDSQAELFNLYVSGQLVGEMLAEFASARHGRCQIRSGLAISDEFLAKTVLSVRNELESGDNRASFELEYTARVLLARIIARHAEVSAQAEDGDSGLSATVLKASVAYIDENLHRRIVPEHLAAIAGVGTAQYARLFKRSFQVTLHQYIIHRRIERAQALLLDTKLSIAEIAHDCGFADQVHLTRLFGRSVGTSPALFRRKSQRVTGFTLN